MGGRRPPRNQKPSDYAKGFLAMADSRACDRALFDWKIETLTNEYDAFEVDMMCLQGLKTTKEIAWQTH